MRTLHWAIAYSPSTRIFRLDTFIIILLNTSIPIPMLSSAFEGIDELYGGTFALHAKLPN